jgi:hypothetical protein
MTRYRATARIVLATVVPVMLGSCAAIRRQQARNTESLLVAAGFTANTPDTAEDAQELQAMPAQQLLSQSVDGTIVYSYADPEGCRCVYVGDEKDYASYRRLVAEQRIAEQRLADAVDVQAAVKVAEDPWSPVPVPP